MSLLENIKPEVINKYIKLFESLTSRKKELVSTYMKEGGVDTKPPWYFEGDIIKSHSMRLGYDLFFEPHQKTKFRKYIKNLVKREEIDLPASPVLFMLVNAIS